MFWFFHVCAIRSFICYLQSICVYFTNGNYFIWIFQAKVTSSFLIILGAFPKTVLNHKLVWQALEHIFPLDEVFPEKNCDDLNLFVVFLRIFADRDRRWILIFPLRHFGDFTEWAALSASGDNSARPTYFSATFRLLNINFSKKTELKIRSFPGQEKWRF